MIYSVKWNNDADFDYTVELSDDERNRLHERMEAAKEIHTFSITSMDKFTNSFADIIDVLATWEV